MKTIEPLIYVGAVEVLPKVYFYLTKKPARFHLFMMRLLLGWKWVANEKQGEQ